MPTPVRLTTTGAVPLASTSVHMLPAQRGPLPDGERFGSLVARHRAAHAQPPAAVAPVAPTQAPAPSPVAPVRGVMPPSLTELGSGLLNRVARGERYVETTVRRGVRGEAFSPEELLVVQAQVYRASQDLELLSKLVEKGTSAVKTVLQSGG